MKRYAPLLTLLSGLVLAGALVTASAMAARPAAAPDSAAATPGDAGATPAASPSPSPSKPPPPKVNAVWAGKVDGGGAAVAISVKDGVAIAYVCDGRRIEAWLRGVAANGELLLEGRNGAELVGRFGNGKATGTVTASGRTWSFTAPAVKKPSGLWRSTAQVRGAEVVGGWIVLDNGEQTGVLNVAGEPEPAPEINVDTGEVLVDGVPLTANPVNEE